MVLDTSALLVLLNDEPEAEAFRAAVEADPVRLTSAASLLEASIVIEARVGEIGGRELDRLMRAAEIQIVSVDSEQVDVARRAFRRYGKGRHSAGLNFGDMFSYALSKSTQEPLLFKGADFGKTDIVAVTLSDEK